MCASAVPSRRGVRPLGRGVCRTAPAILGTSIRDTPRPPDGGHPSPRGDVGSNLRARQPSPLGEGYARQGGGCVALRQPSSVSASGTHPDRLRRPPLSERGRSYKSEPYSIRASRPLSERGTALHILEASHIPVHPKTLAAVGHTIDDVGQRHPGGTQSH